jgi:hypothetical protein
MSKLTSQARREQRKARLKRWVQRNIIMDDPDTNAVPTHDGVFSSGPIVVICAVLGAAFYVIAGWLIFHP